jgi:anti-sigma factor RsiW
MTCEAIRAELVALHFGALDDPRRAEVERHLTGCTACVAEFLALKRDVECSVARPRPQVRASVRQAVARELGLLPAPRSWWERPLAAGLALAAVFLAMTTLQVITTATPSAPVGLARRASP